MDFFVRHPELAALLALAAVIVIWLWYRRWENAGGLETARIVRAINRATASPPPPSSLNYEQLRDKIHREFVVRCRQRMGALPPGSPERAEYTEDVRRVIEHLIDCENPILNRIEREMLITDVAALLGFGPPRAQHPPPEGAMHLKVPRRSET